MKHGLDDILLGVKRVRRPSGREPKQDLLTHVDICRGQVVDLLKDECSVDLLNPKNVRLRHVSG
jgi:hypothetical protein